MLLKQQSALLLQRIAEARNRGGNAEVEVLSRKHETLSRQIINESEESITITDSVDLKAVAEPYLTRSVSFIFDDENSIIFMIQAEGIEFYHCVKVEFTGNYINVQRCRVSFESAQLRAMCNQYFFTYNKPAARQWINQQLNLFRQKQHA